MYAILGDPDRLQAVAEDFINHYANRISDGATVKGKAMFVSSSREIAYELYKKIIAIRPEWNEIREAEEGLELTDKDKRELKPIEQIKLVMTRWGAFINKKRCCLWIRQHLGLLKFLF